MRITIEPTRFLGLPLDIARVADNDFSVTIDGLTAGRIWLMAVAGVGPQWFWSFSGPGLVQGNLNSSGKGATLEEATRGVRECFGQWLERAIAEDKAVYWTE